MMDYYLQPHHYDLAKANGISVDRVQKRFFVLNWSAERAATEPVRQMKGEWKQWKEVAAQHGIKMSTFYQRTAKGMSAEEAATRPLRVKLDIPEWVYEKGLEIGLTRKNVYHRIIIGKWSFEEACTRPKNYNNGGKRERKRKKGGWK